MLRTRVGYTGGTRPARPWYHAIGDHTEALEVVYDPVQIAYTNLLDVFWSSHNPTAAAHSRQYMRAVYVHDDAQAHAVAQSLEAIRTQAAELSPHVQIQTPVLPATPFFVAEDYHQKYRLQQERVLMEALEPRFSTLPELRDSTAAARINGFLAGYGTLDDAALLALELPERARDHLLKSYNRAQSRRRR